MGKFRLSIEVEADTYTQAVGKAAAFEASLVEAKPARPAGEPTEKELDRFLIALAGENGGLEGEARDPARIARAVWATGLGPDPDAIVEELAEEVATALPEGESGPLDRAQASRLIYGLRIMNVGRISHRVDIACWRSHEGVLFVRADTREVAARKALRRAELGTGDFRLGEEASPFYVYDLNDEPPPEEYAEAARLGDWAAGLVRRKSR